MTKIYHFDSFGKRQEKYDLLNKTSFGEVAWKELELKEPYYFFVPKDFGLKEKYDEGFSVSEIFKDFSAGVVISSKYKNGTWFERYFLHGEQNTALLYQIRMFHKNRLQRKIG